MRHRQAERGSARAIVIYGLLSVIAVAIGGLILFAYFERRALDASLAPEPLPRVLLVTDDPRSERASTWVSLLARADLAPVLMSSEGFTDGDGVVMILDRPNDALRSAIERRRREGGGIVLAGDVSETAPFGGIRTTRARPGSGVFVTTREISPVLARIDPGAEIAHAIEPVPVLVEHSTTRVDARWSDGGAAVAHWNDGSARVVWFGFAPRALIRSEDRMITILLRAAFRWLDGQPVSEGAIGETTAVARAMAAPAREAAGSSGFGFSVDPLADHGEFSVLFANRGRSPLRNPTVRVWLPPDVGAVRLGGSPLLRRGATLIPQDDDHSVIVTLGSLSPGQERIVKLTAVDGPAIGRE